MSADAPDREGRLDRLVVAYHDALDRGESPDPAAWVASHPDLAPDLESYFHDLGTLGLLTPPPVASEPGPDPDETVASVAGGSGADDPGQRVGDYVILERLGQGGEGTVFRARHASSDQVVALKTVVARTPADTGAGPRIREEARAIACLKHPHIVPIHFFGEDRGRGVWYYAMDLMEGGSLQGRLKALRDDPRRAASLLEEVARGMHHAHSRGVLHLDLKPANVLLDEQGRPYVSDFGLARRLRASGPAEVVPDPGGLDPTEPVRECLPLSRPQARGTAPYMSPEMAAGHVDKVSTAADVYGLGAVLYATLTGRPPFRGKTIGETLRKVLFDAVEPPSATNPKVDRELQAVCLKALHKDPAKRYGSADAFANDLARWLRGEPTMAGGPTIRKGAWFWLKRHPWRVAATALALVGLWLTGVAGSLGELHASNARDAERLARVAAAQLRMVERDVEIAAKDPDLREHLGGLSDNPSEQRKNLDTFLERQTAETNRRFDLTGGNPLINTFVLNADGVLLADTFRPRRSVGLSFDLRDYYRRHFDPEHRPPRDAVLVSRVYHSVKDGRFKLAVSARVWDGDGGGARCLGVLVANLTVGPALVALDLREEPDGASVVGPVEWTYAWRGTTPEGNDHPPFLAAFDRRYAPGVGRVVPPAAELPRLTDFDRDPALSRWSDRLRGPTLTDYHRVGTTPLVVALRRDYPWPVRVALDPRLRSASLAALALLALALAARAALRRARLHKPLPAAPATSVPAA